MSSSRRHDPTIVPDGSAEGTAVAAFDLVVRACRLEGDPAVVDIAIRNGRVAEIRPEIPQDGERELDAEGRLASPAFVQPHIHLDKVGLAAAVGPNQTGTLAEAISLLHRAKRAGTVEAVAARAGTVIRQAVLSGTSFIRSHVDVDTIGGLVPLRGVLRAAREHADICDVEVVAFPQEGLLRDPGALELMELAMGEGASAVGGMPHWEHTPSASREHIAQCMALARRWDADVDMHVDETDDPASRTLEMLLDATEHHGWEGRVTASHCCAMAAWEDDYVRGIVRRIAELDVNVVTNPATNLLLQGRHDGLTPRRGLPPIKALLEAGVRIGCGQDCVHDAFYPFGAADPLEVALLLCHAAQLSLPHEVAHALASIRQAAAGVVGLESYGLQPGADAHLVVLDAFDSEEALRLQASRRWVVHAGRVVAETETRSVLHRVPPDSVPPSGVVPRLQPDQEQT
jgi:cytosine/creatinine deaminase